MWQFTANRETWHQVLKYTSHAWGGLILVGLIGYGLGIYTTEHTNTSQSSTTIPPKDQTDSISQSTSK
jgi:hypothetical protein